jgi:hypothetical protein
MAGWNNKILAALLLVAGCGIEQDLSQLDTVDSNADALSASNVIYDDTLQNGWRDLSSSAHVLAQGAVVHSGTAAYQATPTAWSQVLFYNGTPVSLSGFASLEFWINGGAQGGQQVDVILSNDSAVLATKALTSLVPGGVVPANAWVKVSISLAGLSGNLQRVYLRETRGLVQGALFVDDMTLVSTSSTTTPTPVTPTPTPTPTPVPVPAGATGDSKVSVVNGQYNFLETFPWLGSHAATAVGGTTTTVWWSEDHWDPHGDTAFISIANAPTSNGYHIDTHKARSQDPRDGRPTMTQAMVGGDGSPGMGVLHMDDYDIIGSRLRNPLLLNAGKTAVISFYASRLNTSSHWWEIALSPTDQPVGAEWTAIPAQYAGRVLPPAVVGAGNNFAATGHKYAQDSINIINVLSSDVPTNIGWSTRFAMTRRINGTSDFFINQRPTFSSLPVQIAPSSSTADDVAHEITELYHWRIEIQKVENGPDETRVYLDNNNNDIFEASEMVEKWNAEIPWNEVHVTLLGVAYSAAEGHPQGAGFLGSIRELYWRNVEVSPVKYAKTAVYPKNNGGNQTTKNQGFSSYDIRDTQRVGPVSPISGAPQPNATAYQGSGLKGIACSEAVYPCFSFKNKLDLSVDVPATPQGLTPARVSLLFDARGQYGFNLIFNGHVYGFVPAASDQDNYTHADGQTDVWMRRSVDIPAAWLNGGANRIQVELLKGPDKLAPTGYTRGVYLDRFEVEIDYTRLQ